MRKIVVFNRVTLDGFFAGPDGEIDWFIPDPEVDKAAHELMRPDTVLFGRVTYQMFDSYWPHVADDPNAPQAAQQLARELAVMTKLVFSTTLQEASWENSRLINADAIDEVKKLKHGEGADMVIFGSGTVIQQLAGEGLIDEYLIALTPVVLGSGKPMFQGVKLFHLKLVEARDFPSGNVLLHYVTDRSESRT